MYISQLPYQADSAQIFAHFVKRPYAVFLDSCGRGRFDIMTADPREVVVVNNPKEDAFALAKQQLKADFLVENDLIPDELPFTIGAIGYFSYDLGYSLAGLTPTALADIALPHAVIGCYDWSIVTDHAERITYFISLKNQTHSDLLAIKNLISQPPSVTNDFILIENFRPNRSKAQYAAAFDQVKRHIHAGDCYQINLAQRFTASYSGSPWPAYQYLRVKNPMPMAAYMSLPEGDILSLSPERFLQVKDGQVITQPIKGTSPRFSNPDEDQRSGEALLASVKDRAENMMIVDLMRNDLGKCCRPGSVKVPKLCALESFSNVHHLVSTIIGTLEEDQHPLDLLRHCFPGGSITGAPKRRAMQIIDQLEPHQRSLYCGSIAYCDIRGRMDSNIAIRTFLCSDHKIHCYGGGGIVSDSTMENEYQEIQVKISRLLSILERQV